MVAEHGNPAALTAGFHLFPAFETRYFVGAQLVDDRTDDCAFGAMMSLALRPNFRKLRFQMIADNDRGRWSYETALFPLFLRKKVRENR
jgi:hypothetical protein